MNNQPENFNVHTEQEIDQHISSELKQGINELDAAKDFEIADIIKKGYVSNKKTEPKTLDATKAGGARISKQKHKETMTEHLIKELKDQGVKESDIKKAVKDHDKKIEELKALAKQIEGSNEFLHYNDSEENIEKYREFLFTTNLFSDEVVLNKKNIILPYRASETSGVEENTFINSYDIVKYNNKDAPKTTVVDPSEQLVLLSRLNKLFNFEFMQQTDTNLKFGDVDRSICAFLKSRQAEHHVITTKIVQHMLKKLLICSMGQMESAFRSDSVWITPEFKRVILPEIIMMQALPEKLKHSFNIFVEELTELKEPRILKDGSKLDYLIRVNTVGVIEQTLARSIKCMTPMFIYDYFEAVKSIYLFGGLLDELLTEKNGVVDEEEKIKRVDILLLARTVLFIYQNSRYLQNSLPRNLPSSKEELSENLQMYYLNHTMTGPQNILLMMMERASISII